MIAPVFAINAHSNVARIILVINAVVLAVLSTMAAAGSLLWVALVLAVADVVIFGFVLKTLLGLLDERPAAWLWGIIAFPRDILRVLNRNRLSRGRTP